MNESMVLRTIEAVKEERVIDLERRIVRIPSFTTEETPLARCLADYMKQIGGDVEVTLQEVPLEGGRISHNVVGQLTGTGNGPTLLLYGHMDHGPIFGRHFESFEGWERDPFGADLEDGWVYGKGSHDEKGGLCALVMACEALVRSGTQLRGDVIFAGVQGHKRRSTGILHMLGRGLRADYAINTEDSGNTIVPVLVGRSEGKIHIRAPGLHPYLKEVLPELKPRVTAFELMNEIQRALGPEMQPPASDSWMTFEPHPDLPGYPQIRMETVEFHGLDHLVLDFQIRTVPGMTADTIRSDVECLLDSFEKKYTYLKTKVEWPLWEHRPALAIPPSHLVVRSLARWHERIAGEPAQVSALGLLGAAADASHTAAAGIETVLYGPGGGATDRECRLRGYLGEGPADERIAVSDLVTATKVLALTAADICG